jgi:hypothetical protein
MVYGLEVPHDHTFTAELERLQPGVAHINAGVPSTAPDAHLPAAQRWMERRRFDAVVLHLFVGNDLAEMDLPYPCCADGPLLRYDDGGAKLRCEQPRWAWALRDDTRYYAVMSPPPLPVRAVSDVSELARWVVVATVQVRDALRGRASPRPDRWEHIEAVLRALRDETTRRGVPLLLVVHPQRSALVAPYPRATEAWDVRARSLDAARRLGVPALDAWDLLADAIRRDGEQRWFASTERNDPHYSVDGHALVARWLGERIDAALAARPTAN